MLSTMGGLAEEQLARSIEALTRRDTKLADQVIQVGWIGAAAALVGTARTAATAVVTSFRAFSAAGLVADAQDRHLVTEARRYLAEG